MIIFIKKFEVKIKMVDNKFKVKILFLKIVNLISGFFFFCLIIINNFNVIIVIMNNK